MSGEIIITIPIKWDFDLSQEPISSNSFDGDSFQQTELTEPDYFCEAIWG